MVNLISQNAARKDGADKGKRKAENSKLVDDVNHGKRKKEEGNEKLEIEQERKTKLENDMFGSIYAPIEFGNHEDRGFVTKVKVDDGATFFVDRHGSSGISVYEQDGGKSEESSDSDSDRGKPIEKEAAWVDEEEEKTKVNIAEVNRLRKFRKEDSESLISGPEYLARLRAYHVKLNPNTQWADPGRDGVSHSDDSDNEGGHVGGEIILQNDEERVVKSGEKLLPGLLEYSRLVDANVEEPSNGPINSVQFHRNAQLLLTAGLDKKLRFFQIDGKRNTKIQSIFLDDCPIRRAAFLPDGSAVIAAGRRKFFYSFDLVKAKVDKIGPLTGREEKSLEVFEVSPDSKTIAFIGNEGYILLVSTRTKELIGTLKMNGTARSVAFTSDGQQLLSTGGDGQIYHWDLRTRACFHKGVDEGCITGTSLCTSPVGNMFAAGSDSGIVNIYKRDEFLGGKRKPTKIIENLTTKVDFMKFNHDAKILAICSSMQKSSLKLIHVPSFSVFSNWPPATKTLHYPQCLDFSPHSGFMAMGNAGGKVLLYKLHHYNQS